MMLTGIGGAYSAPPTTINSQDTMSRDVFLRLLTTQLQHQDPMRPMEDKEFVAQLAQFSSLEQMQNLNAQLETFIQGQRSFQAIGLVGRTVTALDPEEDGETITGKVDSIYFDSGIPTLWMNNKEIPMNLVVSVS